MATTNGRDLYKEQIYKYSEILIYIGIFIEHFLVYIVNTRRSNYTGAKNVAEAAIDSNYLLSYEITDTA